MSRGSAVIFNVLTVVVLLGTPDRDLARKYLDATARYVGMYEKLIGPYPYDKFALVENFWETGFGMPSFTLLGPKIILCLSSSTLPTPTRSSTTGGGQRLPGLRKGKLVGGPHRVSLGPSH